jgi:hypothetical protein
MTPSFIGRTQQVGRPRTTNRSWARTHQGASRAVRHRNPSERAGDRAESIQRGCARWPVCRMERFTSDESKPFCPEGRVLWRAYREARGEVLTGPSRCSCSRHNSVAASDCFCSMLAGRDDREACSHCQMIWEKTTGGCSWADVGADEATGSAGQQSGASSGRMCEIRLASGP